jgi:hypothetical protein
MKRFALAALVVALCGFTASAQDKDAANPTGTWKWSQMGGGGGGGGGGRARETTLKLKLEGDKLTGAIVGRENQETAIEDATFKDGTISFKVTRERNGQKFTMKYEGKLEGDTIKGKVKFDRNGEEMSRDWEAKRVKST